MKKNLLLLSLILVFVTKGICQEGDKVIGKWLTNDKKAHIEIYKCDGKKYCGKIVWLAEPKDENGKEKTDVHNPDKELAKRKLMNLALLTGFEYDSDGEYENGKIYDTREGKIYSCNMELEGDVLEVRGYVGFSLLGRTVVWTRVK